VPGCFQPEADGQISEEVGQHNPSAVTLDDVNGVYQIGYVINALLRFAIFIDPALDDLNTIDVRLLISWICLVLNKARQGIQRRIMILQESLARICETASNDLVGPEFNSLKEPKLLAVNLPWHTQSGVEYRMYQ
jgi:hypothetical protein